MRYAEGTTVSVESSRGEISGILGKHQVTRQAWASEPDGDMVQFELDGNQYRLRIAKPTQAEIFKLFPNHRDTDAKLAAEWRRRWRATVLLLKAKLEFAAGDGPSTIANELMPYLLVGPNKTLGEVIADGGLKQLTAGGSR